MGGSYLYTLRVAFVLHEISSNYSLILFGILDSAEVCVRSENLLDPAQEHFAKRIIPDAVAICWSCGVYFSGIQWAQ